MINAEQALWQARRLLKDGGYMAPEVYAPTRDRVLALIELALEEFEELKKAILKSAALEPNAALALLQVADTLKQTSEEK